jgi:hypothetical protein
MWHNTKVATNLQNGSAAPVLALHKYVKIPASRWPEVSLSSKTANIPCLNIKQHLKADTIAELLDRAGEERFLAKAAGFQTDLAQMEASQSLYRGIMGALGYSKNKHPFLELAHRLPLPTLESTAQDDISDAECCARQQALLLGAAGLLPSQRQNSHLESELDNKWTDKLERLWASSHHTGAMSHKAWHLFKVRPNNSPVRRLVAMSYLLTRYREMGILEELVRLVKEASVSRGYRRLEKGLLVTTNDYWASHFDFGSGKRIRSPTLLGNGRAADIIVNVLLPFTLAWSQSNSQPELRKQALELYRCYPRLAINSMERHMTEQFGLNCSLVNSARRQQGLIHIYDSLCTQGRCNHCPLSQL